jgi:CheY-like chemotaxis protein
MSPLETVPLLVVEDSEDDLFFFRRLLTKAGIKAPLAIATDGQQAIDQLTQAIDPKNTPRPEIPRLVFLDLKLPLRGGFEVLQWIRAQPVLAGVVVAILSSSAETRDVTQAYKFGAQTYLVKYPDPQVLRETVERATSLPPGAKLDQLKLPGVPRP